MPSSRHARMMRTAISPRLAIRTLRNGGSVASLRKDDARPPLERDVAMLLLGVAVPLVGQHLECPDQAGSRLRRLDDVIDVAARGGHVRVGELGFVGGNEPGLLGGRIV